MPIYHLFIFGLIVAVVLILVAAFMPKKASGTVNERVKNIQNRDITIMIKPVANIKAGNVDATTGYTNTLTQQTEAAFRLATADDRLERGEEIEKVTHANTKRVIEDSTNDGMLPANQQAIKVAEATARIATENAKELEEHKVKMQLQSQLDVLMAIVKYRQLRFGQLDDIRIQIFNLIDLEAKIEASNEPARAKGEKLELIAGIKEAYRKVLEANQDGLLETGDTEEIPGIETFDTLDGGFGSGGGAKVEKPIPIKAFGNRRTQADHH